MALEIKIVFEDESPEGEAFVKMLCLEFGGRFPLSIVGYDRVG